MPCYLYLWLALIWSIPADNTAAPWSVVGPTGRLPRFGPGGYVARRRLPEQREKSNKESDTVRAEGVITEALPNTTFRVQLDTGHDLLAYISGKMRIHYIRILPGDRVVLEISPYDTTRGRIVYRK